MNPNLFKSAEFYQRRYHNFATFLIIPLVLLVGFLFTFSFFAKKEVTLTSRGEITPTKIIASIQSTSNNTIIANHLINNQFVEKDKVVIQYSETMESSQKKSLEKQLTNLERQKECLTILKSSLEQGTNLFQGEDEFGYISTFNQFLAQSQEIELGITKTNTEIRNQATIANNTISAIDNQINNIYQQIFDYEELRTAIENSSKSLSPENPHQSTLDSYHSTFQESQGASTTEQYISQINQNISQLQASIDNLNIQKASTSNISTYDNSLNSKVESLRSQFLQNASQQQTTIDTQIIDIQSQLEQASEQLKNNIIKAPESGIVSLNNEFEGKRLIPSGNEIAQIYPNITESKEVFITYYVSSEYVSLLKENQSVRLELEKIGNQSIIINGIVESIDETATKTEQGNLFKVIARASLSKEKSSLIQYGLQGRVTSVIAKKNFFDYYKDKIFKNTN